VALNSLVVVVPGAAAAAAAARAAPRESLAVNIEWRPVTISQLVRIVKLLRDGSKVAQSASPPVPASRPRASYPETVVRTTEKRL
jgi:hypothetical protein